MCSGTLGHIARYHSKTSNNNKTLTVDLLHYDCISSCYPLLVDLYSLYCSNFLIHVSQPLGYSCLLLTCLDSLGFAYSDPEAWNEVEPSTEDQAYFSEQAEQFQSLRARFFLLTREIFIHLVSFCTHIVYFTFGLGCDVIHMYCVILYHILYNFVCVLLVLAYVLIPRFVVYSVSCCTFCLAYIRVGQFLTYVYTSQQRLRIRGIGALQLHNKNVKDS